MTTAERLTLSGSPCPSRSDTICPMCYLGHIRLERAIEQAKVLDLPLDFKLRFLPFVLDPKLAESPGEDKQARYLRKYGSLQLVQERHQALIEQGKSEGISFSFGGRVTDTRRSHRLFAKAWQLKGEESQRKIVKRVFKTYFEEDGDCGDLELLARDAVEAGIFETKEEALAFLRSSEFEEKVHDDIYDAFRQGVRGVPFVVINGKLSVTGAQESSVWLDVFQQIVAGKLDV